MISQFVEEAGKESALKRERLRFFISLAEEFYRAALLTAEQGETSSDGDLKAAVATLLRWMPPEAPAACLEICLDAYSHVDANVNQATFIDWLLDELTIAARMGLATAYRFSPHSVKTSDRPLALLRCSHR